VEWGKREIERQKTGLRWLQQEKTFTQKRAEYTEGTENALIADLRVAGLGGCGGLDGISDCLARVATRRG
jgi:hypothetical protein